MPNSRSRIALVGDFNPAVHAHRAIDTCFTLARASASPPDPHELVSRRASEGRHRHTQEAFPGDLWGGNVHGTIPLQVRIDPRFRIPLHRWSAGKHRPFGGGRCTGRLAPWPSFFFGH